MLWDWALELHRPQCLCPSASSKVSHRFSMDLSDLGMKMKMALPSRRIIIQARSNARIFLNQPTNKPNEPFPWIQTALYARTRTLFVSKMREHCTALFLYGMMGVVWRLWACASASMAIAKQWFLNASVNVIYIFYGKGHQWQKFI